MKPFFKHIILIAIYGAALFLLGILLDEGNGYGLSPEAFIMSKPISVLTLMGIAKIGIFCREKGWMPNWYTEQMASFGYHSPDYHSNKDDGVVRRDS